MIGLYGTAAGILTFLELGIPANKLVLGLPWYGYRYDCISTDHGDRCFIERKQFRNVSCSDAAGRQISYKTIYDLTYNYSSIWDEHSQTPYLYYTVKLQIMFTVIYNE